MFLQEPSVISTDSNQMVRVPLMECVRRTQDVCISFLFLIKKI